MYTSSPRGHSQRSMLANSDKKMAPRRATAQHKFCQPGRVRSSAQGSRVTFNRINQSLGQKLAVLIMQRKRSPLGLGKVQERFIARRCTSKTLKPDARWSTVCWKWGDK